MASEDEFLRSSVALLAHIVKELVATVGAVNALAMRSDNPEIADGASSLDEGLTELHTTVSRLADAFPPPPMNGH